MGKVFTIKLINSEDWPLPDFGPAGPDLEGWDDAVNSWEPEETVLAVIYNDKETAEKFLGHYQIAYAHKGEDHEVEMTVYDPEDVSPSEGILLKDFWSEHVTWIYEDNPDYDGFKTCAEGKPIDWSDDLSERIPRQEDFIVVMLNVLEGDVRDATNSVDYPRDKKRLMLSDTIDEWWILHDRLYDIRW